METSKTKGVRDDVMSLAADTTTTVLVDTNCMEFHSLIRGNGA